MSDARETANCSFTGITHISERFPDAVNTQGRLYIASTACSRSHIATTKQKIIISKIRKNCPLKSSYVAPGDLVQYFRLKSSLFQYAGTKDRRAKTSQEVTAYR